MKTSERLLNASKTIWDAYNEHPFVLGIQNGTLERDKFRYYIMQDFLYLKDYAKTYAVGVAKAKSVETANLFAKYINVMNGELDVHKGYMGKFAVTQEEIDAMKPSLDNLSYTSYMVRVAYDESEVEVLAAVLSALTATRSSPRRSLRTAPSRSTTRSTATGSAAMPQTGTPRAMSS